MACHAAIEARIGGRPGLGGTTGAAAEAKGSANIRRIERHREWKGERIRSTRCMVVVDAAGHVLMRSIVCYVSSHGWRVCDL